MLIKRTILRSQKKKKKLERKNSILFTPEACFPLFLGSVDTVERNLVLVQYPVVQ